MLNGTTTSMGINHCDPVSGISHSASQESAPIPSHQNDLRHQDSGPSSSINSDHHSCSGEGTSITHLHSQPQTSSTFINHTESPCQNSESQASVGECSATVHSPSVSNEASQSKSRSQCTFQSSTSTIHVENGDEEVDEPTQVSRTGNENDIPSSSTSKQYHTDLSPFEAEIETETQATFSSQSAHDSTSTDEPGILTPLLHDSRLIVTVDNSEDQSSTPPPSSDIDDSMMADTTIDTLHTGEDVFFNGDIINASNEDFAMADTDSEADEDSDEDDVPVIPRLLTYAIPTPVKNKVRQVRTDRNIS